MYGCFSNIKDISAMLRPDFKSEDYKSATKMLCAFKVTFHTIQTMNDELVEFCKDALGRNLYKGSIV